jgi:hypothetical protein
VINIGEIKANVLATAAVTVSIAVIAVWQFRLFVTYEGPQGLADMSGGTHHLWWAVGAGLAACVASFYVFSALARHDEGNGMTII